MKTHGARPASLVLVLAVLSVSGPPSLASAGDRYPSLVDLAGVDRRFVFDIRYATPDNVFGRRLYSEARCLLLAPVARRLVEAQDWLDAHHPGLRLLLKDCYRPDAVQRSLWEAVRGTPQARYVADPGTATGSIHAYGAAIDVTLADASGVELDLGTPYDHLGPRAEPRHERRLLAAGELTPEQVRNRRILRRALRSGRFVGIRNEWWHFNAAPAKVVRSRYRRLDVPFSSVPRPSAAATSTAARPSRGRGK